MYAVVGCGDCEALWIVETGADSSQCPRCGKTRKLAKRAKLATAEDEDRARDLRTQLLAERQGVDADVSSFSALEGDVDDAGIDDEAYLSESGLDPDAVAAAGERAESGSASGGDSGSRREIVERAISTLEEPTAAAITEFASERGVPEEAIASILDRLVRSGEAIERDGVYRRL